MRYGYVYVTVCIAIVIIGIFAIFQQESFQSEKSNSITIQNPNLTHQRSIDTEVTQAGCEDTRSHLGSVGLAGSVRHADSSPLRVPCFTTTIVPDQIYMKRGSSTDVTVYLNYKYVSGFNAPQQLVVYMTPQHNALTGPLKIWANLTDEQLANRMDAYDANGTSPPGMYNTTQLESYPNPGPILVNANETNSTIMRITIPLNYPEEFLNKGIHLNAIANISYPHLAGYMGGFNVIVNG